jgi:hypothetical protein
MCKYIVLLLFVILAALMVVAVVVVQEYGWTGFVVLLGALVLLGYVVRKALPYFVGRLATRPLRQMGAALRGARIVVHVVEPCDPPEGYNPNPPDDPEAIEDDGDAGEEPEEDMGGAADEGEPAAPCDWYRIVLTVVPPGDESSEGRIVVRRAWSPQFVGAVGPRPPLGRPNPFGGWPPPDQFTDAVRNAPVGVWTGSDYELAGESLYGEQRLRLRVGVTRAVRAVTIVYALFTELGVVPLPRIDVRPGDGG